MKKIIASGFLGGIAAITLFLLMAPRDGNGNYSLPAGNPTIDGQTITANLWNTTFSDLATSMTSSIAKDGQTTPTANLPMGGFKHTGVADATARNHYASVGQIQDAAFLKLGSVAGTNTITANLTPAITAYVAGMQVTLIPVGNNTTAVTLATNGLTALDVQKYDGDALVSGDLVTGIPAVLALDTGGDDWILLNPQTNDASAAAILSRLLTVDGAGSGLDADLLDGQSSAFYQSASNLNAGTVPDARFPATLPAASGANLTSLNASNLASGTVADARVSSSSVTQHMDDGYGRNITGKAGTTKTLSTSAPSGGSDGDIWYRY